MKSFWTGTSALARAGALAALVGGAMGAAAVAQDDDAAASERPRDVIQVTSTTSARKFEEDPHDVPMSLSGLTDAEAEDLVLDDVTDYIRQTPGAILVSAGPAYLNDIALRGQGGGRLGFTESTTGIYRNGIYVAGGGFGGRTFSSIDFFDMQSFQVYRGPQGALYGRNAVGGAANIVTRRPEADLGGRVKAGYNDVQEHNVQAVANLPVTDDTFAVRIGGYTSERDDGFHHLASTGEALDREREWGGRASALWTPDADTSVLVMAEQSYSEAPGFASLGQNLALDPDPYTHVGLDIVDMVTIDQTSSFGELRRSFGFGDLTILVNALKRDGDRENGDLDHFLGFNTALLSLIDEQYEDFERRGAEARLSSKDDSRLLWIVGVDYQSFTSDVISQRTGALAGPFAASAALRAQLRRDVSTEELDSTSVFGLVGFDVTDRLNLTFEGRIQDDSKNYVFERIDLDPFTDDAIAPTPFEQSQTKFLPTASFLYRLNDAHNLYGRVATGYRPGGFNPQPQPGFFDLTPYGPETAYSAELGWKAATDVGRVSVESDLSVFYTMTDDIQTTTQLSPLATGTSLQNVGDAAIYGAEYSLRAYAPLWGGQTLTSFGLSTATGEYQDGTSVIFNGVTYDLSGYRPPRNRDYIVNLATAYTRPLSPTVDGFASVSFQAEGGGYDNPLGPLNVAQSRSSDSFEMIDLKLGVGADTWRFSIYGKNITDETYRLVTLNGNAYHNEPRVFGAELSAEF